MIDKSAIDPNALHFYRQLKESGFAAYFVGGSVRDLLLGKLPKDFDIATNATPQQIKRVIPQGRIIGRRFRHVMLEKNGGRYEIVTFRGPVVPAEELAELEPPAVEAEAAEDSNGPDRREKRYPDLNQFGNAEQDALRRDFTINALFYDPDADELVDYVEGKLDIDRKIIRTIGDSLVRMEEDPIRILRAIRHKMKLGLEYDPSLENAMREKAALLNDTSKDRIREEFLKVCNDQSLADFLKESQRLGLAPHIMPWFGDANEEAWEKGQRLWDKFREMTPREKMTPDFGLALMMVPLIEPLVLTPYRSERKEDEKNYLPDMKYFLSCEPLRNYYLRNLRISRAQTDYLVRALFYFSRMTGLWIEQGPPRRIIGRLFQHPSAVLAARMSRLQLELDGREIPDWINDLANYEPGRRRRDSREDQYLNRENRDDSTQEEASGDEESQPEETNQAQPLRERPIRENKTVRLPPPDQPMIWNGPLHAPVLRPIFSEEATIRWARKNQTVRAFRPSGIPNQPVDHSLLKSSLVYNYKPEIEVSEKNETLDSGDNRSRRKDRRGGHRGRDRNRDRPQNNADEAPAESENTDMREDQPNNEQRSFRHQNTQQPRTFEVDEDSIGNVLRPGEQPAPLSGFNAEFEDDIDDNIGNRLDAPPTSGHVGVNGDGFIQRSSRPQGRFNPSNRGHGGQGGGPRRGGGRNKRRGRNGGGGRGGQGGGGRGPSRGPFSPQ